MPRGVPDAAAVQRFEDFVATGVALEWVCDQVASGVSLKAIAELHQLPYPRLAAFCRMEPNREAYLIAREARADWLVDEALEMADDRTEDWKTGPNGLYFDKLMPARARLQFDVRRWMASKYKAEYQDKPDKVTVEAEVNVIPAKMSRSRLLQIAKGAKHDAS